MMGPFESRKSFAWVFKEERNEKWKGRREVRGGEREEKVEKIFKRLRLNK